MSEPFPMENPCSENVRESNSLSNSSESGSTHHLLRKFLAYHLYRDYFPLLALTTYRRMMKQEVVA